MTTSLADIRRFLTDYFNDEELTGLCFDHFHEVFCNFPTGATTGRKGLLLLDYCQRRDRIPELLAILKRDRPEPYRRVFGRQRRTTDRRININSADIDELRSLPGIGQKIAERIVANRPYRAVDELLKVPHIGPARLEALRDWCTV